MSLERRAGPWPGRIAVVVLIVAAIVVAEVASGGGSEKTGRVAPPLPAEALRPPGTDLAALRGKPALVDFFASWCDPCAEEAPQLRRLAASLGARATVVAVDWDDAGGPARAFVREHRWTFPVLADTSGKAGESYGLVGLPTSFVLDPSGRIVATFRGPQSAATLRRAILDAA